MPYQYNLKYRDWDIAADLSGSITEIYIDNGFSNELIYEGVDLFNTIVFFEVLDTLIDKYEAKRDVAAAQASNPDADRDDIPF